LFHPARASVDWSRRHGAPTTLAQAYDLILQTVPKGSTVAVERFVLQLPGSLYQTVAVDRLTDQSTEEYVSSGVSFVVAVLGPSHEPKNPEAFELYHRRLAELDCLPTVAPTADRTGPAIGICRVPVP
jgi:hypothetical protein